MIRKIRDFLSDLRSPLHYSEMHREYENRTIVIRDTPRQKDISFCITVDVEQDYGSLSTDSSGAGVSAFLDSAKDQFKEIGKGCFFVQGSLLKTNWGSLREYTKAGYDVGLHGYYHELWGSTQWYLNDKPQPIKRKKELLQKAIEESEELGLKLEIFRAPNMAVDNETLSMLSEEGFSCDSSQAVHRGETPLPSLASGLKRVPVSANPFPVASKKFGLKFHSFEVFNLLNLIGMDSSYLVDYVDRITRYQVANRIKPHLVFLCHSWEFCNTDSRDPRLSYSSSNNYDLVKEHYDILRREFGCMAVNFHELCESISFS